MAAALQAFRSMWMVGAETTNRVENTMDTAQAATIPVEIMEAEDGLVVMGSVEMAVEVEVEGGGCRELGEVEERLVIPWDGIQRSGTRWWGMKNVFQKLLVLC